ncbi:hypothetical protein N7474_002428, partial [Penicillium riverlandense]|uniref:uncharacterized protein n=1 Tax=Penicillium riverlandense TaxID=1903569 RepID=UPI002546B97C
AKLKQVVDMAVFSQLLEMDDDEDSSALYGFIDTDPNTVEDMNEALSSPNILCRPISPPS